MKRYIVQIQGSDVPVTFARGLLSSSLTWNMVRGFKPFQDYCSTMEQGLVVRSIHVQSIDVFSAGRIGFMKIKSDIVIAGHTHPVPGIAFLRGGAVVILIVLVCMGREYVVIVRQPRTPIGRLSSIGFPAGMLDGQNDFHSKAIEELKEEVGLVVETHQLVDLTHILFPGARGIHTSGGGSDEFLRILLHRRVVSPEELNTFHGRITGLHAHGEYISTEIVPVEDVRRVASDAGMLLALHLYDTLRDRV